MIADTTLVSGHPLLSDWLLLIAAILFVIAAVLTRTRINAKVITAVEVAYIGLALFAVGFLVL